MVLYKYLFTSALWTGRSLNAGIGAYDGKIASQYRTILADDHLNGCNFRGGNATWWEGSDNVVIFENKQTQHHPPKNHDIGLHLSFNHFKITSLLNLMAIAIHSTGFQLHPNSIAHFTIWTWLYWMAKCMTRASYGQLFSMAHCNTYVGQPPPQKKKSQN